MPEYNLIKYSDVYLKTSGSLWQYRNEPALDNNNNIINFPAKQQITGKTRNGGTKYIEISMVLLKYLSNLQRTLEIPLISCEINLQLKWSKNEFQLLLLQIK